jgi:hypothetical protein
MSAAKRRLSTTLAATFALALLALPGGASAELITPHAATPETVTPHEVTPAPEAASALEAAPEPTLEAEYGEQTETASEAETEAEGQKSLHPGERRPGGSRGDTTPTTDSSGRFTPITGAPWRDSSCGWRCQIGWVKWADNELAKTDWPRLEVIYGTFYLTTSLGSDFQQVLTTAIRRWALAYVSADATSLLGPQSNSGPASSSGTEPAKDETKGSDSDTKQSRGDAPVDNPFEGYQEPGTEKCRAGSGSDTNDQVEDGKSGSNVCR